MRRRVSSIQNLGACVLLFALCILPIPLPAEEASRPPSMSALDGIELPPLEELAEEKQGEKRDVARKSVGVVLSGLPGEVFLPSGETNPERRAAAVAIWNEAAALQLEERYGDALEKYREGLLVSEDAIVREHAIQLERFIERRRERDAASAARERAVAFWNEAAALQLAERYEEALEKYREGIALSYDPVVEEHAGKLEEFIERRKRRESEKSSTP